MFVWGSRGSTTHTHAHNTHHCVFFNSLLLHCPPLHLNCSDDPNTPSPLVHTHSCPLLTPLVTSRSIMGGSAVLPVLFDPFHTRLNCRDPISQLESPWKLSTLTTKWTRSQFKSQQVPWLQTLLWYSLHAIESGIPRHHMLKERRWAHQERFMCIIWSEPPVAKSTFISVKSVEG